MVYSPCVKFEADTCHSDRDIAIKQIFKMAAAAILDFLRSVKYEVNFVTGTLFLVYVPNCMQICVVVTELWPLK